MDRFFENKHLLINQQIFLDPNNTHKILNVLKLKTFSKIILFNNTNQEFIGEIIAMDRNSIAVKILTQTEYNRSSPIKIHLAQAIAKHDNMDLIIQKAVELGISSITPIITARTIVKPKNSTDKIKHWQAIATAACCQCGNNLIPIINPITKLNDFVRQSNTSSHKFILTPINSDPRSTNHNELGISLNKPANHNNPDPANPEKVTLLNSVPSMSNLQIQPNNFQPVPLLKISEQIQRLQIQPNNILALTILIGPEGGFSHDEIILTHNYQFQTLNLGPRILRTETAAIAIISIFQEKFGDL